MNNQRNNKYELLTQLISGLFAGELSGKQFDQLQQMLSDDPKCLEYYIESAMSWAMLDEMGDLPGAEVLDEFDPSIMEELAREERNAPALVIEPTNPEPELITKVVYQRSPRNINKFNLYSALISAAALLCVILYLKFAPVKPYSVEVATLIDQVNTVWDESEGSLKTGDRLMTNQYPMLLKEGVARIYFDEGVEVLLEGPAQFEIRSKGLYLEYGRLYSDVSDTGQGFTVDTPYSRYIDLGTTFGVKSALDGISELHVFKGKVQAYAGVPGKAIPCQTVEQDNAIRFNPGNGQLKEIRVQKNTFVCAIDSETGQVWRHQNKIDLADIVGGGTGFGTGKLDVQLDMFTGKNRNAFGKPSLKFENLSPRAYGDGVYHKIPKNPFVDGIFVPDRKQGPVTISSSGMIFQECPETSNIFRSCPINGSLDDDEQTQRTPVMNGIEYGLPGKSSLFMHSNIGITFDLQALRRSLGGRSFSLFRSQVGISERAGNKVLARVDVWILVDGKLVNSCTGITQGQFVPLNIPLDSYAQFLTLIVTDGGCEGPEWDDENRRQIYSPIIGDHCFFADPTLLISEESN